MSQSKLNHTLQAHHHKDRIHFNLVQTFLGVNWDRQIEEQQADPEKEQKINLHHSVYLITVIVIAIFLGQFCPRGGGGRAQ